MKIELQEMRKKAIELLKKPDIVNPSILEQLAKLPAELQQMEQEFEKFNSRMTRISSQLESCANDDTRNNSGPSIMNHGIYSRQGGVLIHIDRKSFGLPEGTETIRERWESDTLVRFVEFIYHALGNSSLEKLSKLRINRGPFVSNNPSQDYKYQTHRGRTKMYAHKSILGTGYFVLTNNTCDEKIDCINAAWKYLGLPAGSVKVEKMIS